MVITKDYQLQKRENLYYVISKESLPCPVCKGRLFLIGSRKRRLILNTAEKISLVIKRYRCKECRKIHHELPTCCVPYKRYETETVENIIMETIENKKETEKTEAYPCEKSTAQKLLLWYRSVLFCVYMLLEKNKIKWNYSFLKMLSQKYFSKNWLGYLIYELNQSGYLQSILLFVHKLIAVSIIR
jgi:hypothetical protein